MPKGHGVPHPAAAPRRRPSPNRPRSPGLRGGWRGVSPLPVTLHCRCGRSSTAVSESDSMSFDANAVFEAELARRGVSFVREDEHIYRIQVGDWTVSANVENVRRNAERDEDPGIVVRFVDHVLGFSGRYPSWSEASTLLFWSA